MDLSQLEDMLEENAYVPTFNKAPRVNNNKSLTKNSSNKSLDTPTLPNPSLTTPLEKPRNNNLFQLHKDSRKQATTFQDFFKQNNEPKKQVKQQPKTQTREAWKQTKPTTTKRDDFNINNLLDEDEEAPTPGIRKMKPPIARKNDDNKSVASRRNDDNRSVASITDARKPMTFREQEKISFAFQTPFVSTQLDPLKQKEEPPPNRQVKQIHYGPDPELMRILNQQLQLQRQLNQKLLKEEQETHQAELTRLKTMHEQQLKKKVELKDFEIQKLKQFYEMQLAARTEKEQQMKGLSVIGQRVQESIKAFQRAEENLKTRTEKFEDQRSAKNNQMQSFQSFVREKEKYIQELTEKLQTREQQFRLEKLRIISDLQRERKKMEESQFTLRKRERQLEDKYLKRQRTLIEDHDLKNRKINDEESRLRMDKMQIEQEKLKYQQQREQTQIRQRKWEENRTKLMEEVQLERTKLISRQVQLNSKNNEWEARDSEMSLRERQLTGKMKLVELQRRKWEIDREVRRKPGLNDTKPSFAYRERSRDQPSGPIEKSIKQLKDEYLRNLGQL